MAARDVEDGAKELGRTLKGGAKKMAVRPAPRGGRPAPGAGGGFTGPHRGHLGLVFPVSEMDAPSRGNRASMHRPGRPAPGTGDSVPGPPEGNGSSPVLVLAGAMPLVGGR